MSHYFTNDYNASNRQTKKTKIKDQDYIFITDNGVFSKKGLDFGTRTLLENIDVEALKGDILDFGCGYGPIGIFLAKNTDANIDMIDINQRSLDLARENADLNKVKTNIFWSDTYKNITKQYDHIITNPPIRVGKKILYKILFEAKDHLKTNGCLWLVVNKQQGAKSLIKDLEKVYKTEVIKKNKGFYIIKSQKY